MDRKSHWENVYTNKSHTQVSWFTEHVLSSLKLIELTKVPFSASIIDVGGGASTLVDDLIEKGFVDITVMDISKAALQIAKERLKGKQSKINWIEADILESDFRNRKYDVWHDRAVFHFLTSDEERARYKAKLSAHLNKGGFAIFSVFADDGPLKCSMLEVKRHSEEDIKEYLGKEYSTIFEERIIHLTPAKVEQKFVNIILKRE